MTSDTNAERLRLWAEAWQMNPDGGPLIDRNSGEADLVSHFDPEITYEDTALPDHAGETYRGVDGVIRATERWVEPFEEMTIDLEQSSAPGTGWCQSTDSARGHVAPAWRSTNRLPSSGRSDEER